MTDPDSLRDRIADLLWRTDEKSWEDQAQAIIDEFGLTMVEAPMMGAEWEDGNWHPVIEQRVVGKWEKQ